jgi:hypothetical protein
VERKIEHLDEVSMVEEDDFYNPTPTFFPKVHENTKR